MVQTLFCYRLRHPGLFVFAVCFDAMVDSLIEIIFHLSTEKKVSYDEQIFCR